MYNVLIVCDKANEKMSSQSRNISFIPENKAGEVTRDECEVLVMNAKTAERLMRNGVDIRIDGVETVILTSEKTKDLKYAADGLHFIDEASGKEEIKRIVDNIADYARIRRAKENFERMVLEEAERVKPIIREQFLRDYILGVGDSEEIFKIYCKTFDVPQGLKTRMVILHTDPEPGFEEQFFVKNLAEGYIGKQNILLSTSVKEGVLFVVSTTDEKQLCEPLVKIANALERYYDYSANIVYSDEFILDDAPGTYEHLKRCMPYCFYSRNEHVASAGDITIPECEPRLDLDYIAIEKSLKSNDTKTCTALLDSFFGEIERVKLDPAIAKTYCLELYICVIRCCEAEKIDKYMKGITEFQALKTLDDIKSYINNIAEEIIAANGAVENKTYSTLISETLRLIENNIGNEDLSLRWLAGSVLYTNVDYLGKLFKKEVGENFSHYVMKKRMEFAKKLILSGSKDKIYEVAEKVGYGTNSQYFSQVFKRYTGTSPLEYKEFSRKQSGNE